MDMTEVKYVISEPFIFRECKVDFEITVADPICHWVKKQGLKIIQAEVIFARGRGNQTLDVAERARVFSSNEVHGGGTRHVFAAGAVRSRRGNSRLEFIDIRVGSVRVVREPK